jgi:hypothetical protein
VAVEGSRSFNETALFQILDAGFGQGLLNLAELNVYDAAAKYWVAPIWRALTFL